MFPCADTNFLGHFYLDDDPNPAAERVWQERGVLPVTWLLRLELVNAFQQAVFSGFGPAMRRISPELAAASQENFRADLSQGIFLRVVDPPQEEVTRLFEDIALRHTARHGFRAYDILHVASALALGCDAFWSLDRRAAKLAKLEGLKTILS